MKNNPMQGEVGSKRIHYARAPDARVRVQASQVSGADREPKEPRVQNPKNNPITAACLEKAEPEITKVNAGAAAHDDRVGGPTLVQKNEKHPQTKGCQSESRAIAGARCKYDCFQAPDEERTHVRTREKPARKICKTTPSRARDLRRAPRVRTSTPAPSPSRTGG
jgi:hypothetical protein